MTYRLTREAEADIIEIAEIGIRTWGIQQAQTYHNGLFELFELIASKPEMPDREPSHRRRSGFSAIEHTW